tara:strand:+ start:138 stop:608 length:471 start_codon:yes stop_codon:yes gene_type:complete
MNNKTEENYKRSMIEFAELYIVEFGFVDSIKDILLLINDVYIIMYMNNIEHNTIYNNIHKSLQMFISSLKQLEPSDYKSIQITHQMYSCFIRACMPNIKIKNISKKNYPVEYKQYTQLLIQHIYKHQKILKSMHDISIQQLIQQSKNITIYNQHKD